VLVRGLLRLGGSILGLGRSLRDIFVTVNIVRWVARNERE